MDGEIAEAKDRLRIPELWRLLELPGKPGKECHSPFRKDKKCSFSVYDDGRRAHDFSSGKDYDAIDFLAEARGTTNGEAVREFISLAGGVACSPARMYGDRESLKVEESLLPDLSWLRRGSESELAQVANSRRLDLAAVCTAQEMGLLRFGTIRSFPSWIVTDCSGRCAEGRRLDGKLYPAWKTKQSELKARKSHAIFRSRKNWPVGIEPEPQYRNSFTAIALVEGGPDLLAAIHFALRYGRKDILPVAILGRGVCRHGFHSDSLDRFRGRRVKIYVHEDKDFGSYDNAVVLGKQLQLLGCELDFWTFRESETKGFRKVDGSPVKDLNDCVDLAPEQLPQLEGLFP